MKTTKILVILAAIFIAQLYLASALTISSVTTDPTTVQPGQQVNLDLSIKNSNPDQDVSGITVGLILNGIIQPVTGSSQQITVYPSVPFSPYQSSNQRTIESISSDDHETIHFDLIANSDATSGTYTVPLTASYTLDNGTPVSNELIGTVSITINAKPQIVVSAQESSLIKGTTGKITLMIVNSGLGGSKFLTVGVSSVQGITLTSPSNVYIGNIDSNDFDTADFNIFVNTNAPSTINLPVQVTYTDSTNNQITENQIISVKTYTQKEAISLGLAKGNSTFIIILVVVLVIIIFLIYRRARKKRRNNGRT